VAAGRHGCLRDGDHLCVQAGGEGAVVMVEAAGGDDILGWGGGACGVGGWEGVGGCGRVWEGVSVCERERVSM
jgi:hypothetical protein